ncbi:unnamed protein product [Merluccius merluccius]
MACTGCCCCYCCCCALSLPLLNVKKSTGDGWEKVATNISRGVNESNAWGKLRNAMAGIALFSGLTGPLVSLALGTHY